MMCRQSPTQNGFTLIEAMVAMAILAIAATGIIRAAEAHVDTLRGLEQRACAQWVAENALAEAGAGLPVANGNTVDATMLGWRWQYRVRTLPSDDRDLRQIIIDVRAPTETTPTVSLRGFFDTGNTTL